MPFLSVLLDFFFSFLFSVCANFLFWRFFLCAMQLETFFHLLSTFLSVDHSTKFHANRTGWWMFYFSLALVPVTFALHSIEASRANETLHHSSCNSCRANIRSLSAIIPTPRNELLATGRLEPPKSVATAASTVSLVHREWNLWTFCSTNQSSWDGSWLSFQRKKIPPSSTERTIQSAQRFLRASEKCQLYTSEKPIYLGKLLNF